MIIDNSSVPSQLTSGACWGRAGGVSGAHRAPCACHGKGAASYPPVGVSTAGGPEGAACGCGQGPAISLASPSVDCPLRAGYLTCHRAC